MGEVVPRNDLLDRTKSFALAVIRLVKMFRRELVADVIARQLLRSATSVAANYRSARRARSRRDFIAKMAIVEEEADESQFWLELAGDAEVLDSARIAPMRKEAGELVAITVASIRTARRSPRDVPRSAVRVPRSGDSSNVHR
jgi:four helix bundle protein